MGRKPGSKNKPKEEFHQEIQDVQDDPTMEQPTQTFDTEPAQEVKKCERKQSYQTKPLDLISLVTEYQTERRKLDSKYLDKIHKLMGI